MGRPKGLRKAPDGSWYMPEQEKTMLAEEPKLKVQLPVYKRKEERFRRNDLVSVEQDIGRIPSVVLGYQEGKVVTQGIYTQERQTVAESRVIPLQESAR